MTDQPKNPRKNNLLVVAAVLVGGAVAAYLLAAPGGVTPKGGASSAEPAPALSGPTLDGRTLALADFKGKVVLVDFWATWCDPCKEEIPGLGKLYDKLKDQGFVLLGDSMDEEGAAAVKKFMKKQAIPYPCILNGGERPPQGWLVPGLPTAYLIGRDGRVLKRWFGEKDLVEVETLATAALAQK